MFGYFLNSIGFLTITSYATLNYLTYQTINTHITENNKFKAVYLSPIFNYHHQLQKQMSSNSWNYFEMTPTQFKHKENISVLTLSMNINRYTYNYSYKMGDYTLTFGKGN